MGSGIYLIVLIVAFVVGVAWIFSRSRRARFEEDGKIPFEEKDD